MAAKPEKTFTLKVIVHKEKNRVVFAESDNEFVDILLSFLTLPMGTVIRLVRNRSTARIGCMENLYKSVENLDTSHLRTEACRTMLLRPRRSSEFQCRKLKVNVDDMESGEAYQCSSHPYIFVSFYPNLLCPLGDPMNKKYCWKESDVSIGGADDGEVFVKRGGLERYIISDNLQVLAGGVNNKFMDMLEKLGIRDFSVLQEQTLNLGLEEVLQLLSRSLTSNTPLTDIILSKNDALIMKAIKNEPSECIQGHDHSGQSVSEGKKISVKLVVRKSNNKILFAETGEDFIDLLFQFLTFPLGSIVNLCTGNSSLTCIDNLYNSIQGLTSHFKSPECEAMLASPMLFPYYHCGNQILLPNEVTCRPFSNSKEVSGMSYCNINTNLGIIDHKLMVNEKSSREGFMMGPATFMVTDELEVIPLSYVSKVMLFSKWNVPINDIEEHYVNVGKEEALNLLKVSLVSEKVLSIVFNQK